MVQAGVAFFATLAFAIKFGAPRHLLWTISLGGALCWSAYLLFLRLNAPVQLACFAATFILVMYARLLGVLLRTPVIVFLVTGVFPLVPGAAIYHMAYFLFMGQEALGAEKGMEALVTAGVIALGMIFGYALPQKLFDWVCKHGLWFLRKKDMIE